MKNSTIVHFKRIDSLDCNDLLIIICASFKNIIHSAQYMTASGFLVVGVSADLLSATDSSTHYQAF